MNQVQWTPVFRGVVAQTIWNCGWSRPAAQVAADHGKPASVWVCARVGDDRRVCERECEMCPHWINE
jgi:hypothetical protein